MWIITVTLQHNEGGWRFIFGEVNCYFEERIVSHRSVDKVSLLTNKPWIKDTVRRSDAVKVSETQWLMSTSLATRNI